MVAVVRLPARWGACLAALAALMLLALPARAATVRATGFGVDQDQALASALRAAVESGVGVDVDGRSMVENFAVVKDEIVTHAKGYVSSYKVVDTKKETDGGVAVTVDAVVDAGLIKDHARVLDILMKMTGHPRVLIFGVDEDLDSVPAGTEQFEPLTKAVADVFRDSFRFEVIDWDTAKARNKGLPGKPDRKAVVRNNAKIKSDYYVTVALDMGRASASGQRDLTLALAGVRTSDDYQLAKAVRPAGSIDAAKLKPAALYARAVDKALDAAFPASVEVAKAMVADLQSEAEGGRGFRYTLGFYDFPDQKLILAELAGLPGYVRHKVDKSDRRNLSLAYWSHLKSDELLAAVGSMLEKRGIAFKHKQDGRVLKFKWEHPEGF